MVNIIMCHVIQTEKFIEDIGWTTTYGLVHKNNKDKSLTVENISCNYQFVTDLAKKIINNKASAIHFMDIIEDEIVM